MVFTHFTYLCPFGGIFLNLLIKMTFSISWTSRQWHLHWKLDSSHWPADIGKLWTIWCSSLTQIDLSEAPSWIESVEKNARQTTAANIFEGLFNVFSAEKSRSLVVLQLAKTSGVVWALWERDTMGDDSQAVQVYAPVIPYPSIWEDRNLEC